MKNGQTAIVGTLLCKMYTVGNSQVQVLKNVEFEIMRGEFATLTGPSGSGKTTLLNIIGGIDKPSRGSIMVFGEDLSIKGEDFLSDFRCRNIGFVFQAYNLVSTLTVAENVAFPMEWLRKKAEEIRNRVEELLNTVGLENRKEHFPSQLSDGEQQRVAFARALSNDPPLLLVDEPTGNLDSKTSLKIIQMLKNLRDSGKTTIVATHDARILGLSDRLLCLEDGKLVKQNE